MGWLGTQQSPGLGPGHGESVDPRWARRGRRPERECGSHSASRGTSAPPTKSPRGGHGAPASGAEAPGSWRASDRLPAVSVCIRPFEGSLALSPEQRPCRVLLAGSLTAQSRARGRALTKPDKAASGQRPRLLSRGRQGVGGAAGRSWSRRQVGRHCGVTR